MTKFKAVLKTITYASFILGLLFLSGCGYNPNGPAPIDYPFYKTTKPLVVKNVEVPIGTKLIYKKHFFKEGRQRNIMNEKKLKSIEFPVEPTVKWGGVPITMITKFYNPDMTGYTVTFNFEALADAPKTNFSKLWQSCNEDLSITVNNKDDWSFNKDNIITVESCGVNYQRYFKDDPKQQEFLDRITSALLKVETLQTNIN